MPALHLLVDSSRRIAQIRDLSIFSEDLYFRYVYLPILDSLGIQRPEISNRMSQRKYAPVRLAA
jgi:hypothetical protein